MKHLRKTKFIILLFFSFVITSLQANVLDAVNLFQNIQRVLGNDTVEYKNVIEVQEPKDRWYIRKFINSSNCDNETKHDFFTICDKKETNQTQYVYYDFITDTLSTKEKKYKDFKEMIYPLVGDKYSLINKEIQENLFMFGKGHVILSIEDDGVGFITWGRYIQNSKKCYFIPNNQEVKNTRDVRISCYKFDKDFY